MGGWQEYSVVDADQPGALRKVDTTHVPLSHYLGAVGMPGVTAWYGLVKIIEPKAGQTVVVSAASGAVGSAVGALAKARGCRAVGIAGGADKCRYVTEELGFDACIDYKQHKDAQSLSKALKEACPDGIDGYFENVGGMVLDAVLLRANAFARIALCGMIAGYDGQPIPLPYPQLILTNRMRVEGFIVSEHMEVWPEALKELGTLVATGKLRPREIGRARASRPRPRPSWACSRAATSASSWSSWSTEAPRRGRAQGRGVPRGPAQPGSAQCAGAPAARARRARAADAPVDRALAAGDRADGGADRDRRRAGRAHLAQPVDAGQHRGGGCRAARAVHPGPRSRALPPVRQPHRERPGRPSPRRLWVAAFHVAAPLLALAVGGLHGLLLYAVLWMLPLVTVLQPILRLRAIFEHGAVDDLSSPLTAARTNRTWGGPANWLARCFLFPHHVNYHLEHHLYPAVPHYFLPRLHRLLQEKDALGGAEVRDIRDTWQRVFAARRSDHA